MLGWLGAGGAVTGAIDRSTGLSSEIFLDVAKKKGGDLEMVVKKKMVVVAKGKLLKSRLPRRSTRR